MKLLILRKDLTFPINFLASHSAPPKLIFSRQIMREVLNRPDHLKEGKEESINRIADSLLGDYQCNRQHLMWEGVSDAITLQEIEGIYSVVIDEDYPLDNLFKRMEFIIWDVVKFQRYLYGERILTSTALMDYLQSARQFYFLNNRDEAWYKFRNALINWGLKECLYI